MADVSAPPPGVTSPEGMRSPEEALFPREDTYFQDSKEVTGMSIRTGKTQYFTMIIVCMLICTISVLPFGLVWAAGMGSRIIMTLRHLGLDFNGMGMEDAETCLLLALVFQADGQMDRALSLYEEYQDLKPSPSIYVMIGDVHSQAGRYKEAEAAYRRALAEDPELARGNYGLGRLLAQTDRIQEAIAALEKAIAIAPDLTPAYVHLAALLAVTDDTPRAIESLEKAGMLDPVNPEIHYRLGQLYRQEEDTQAAVHAFDRCLQLSPGYKDAAAMLEELTCHRQPQN